MCGFDPTLPVYGVSNFAFIPANFRLGPVEALRLKRDLLPFPTSNGAESGGSNRPADVAQRDRELLADIGIQECEVVLVIDGEAFDLGPLTHVNYVKMVGVGMGAWMHEAMRRGGLYPRPRAPVCSMFYVLPKK